MSSLKNLTPFLKGMSPRWEHISMGPSIATGFTLNVAPASEKYVGELDGVRALAVCLVVSAHYRLIPYVPGGFGVTLFFFLSGYLITTLFYAEQQRASKINVRQFYLRRWLRLTPPLLVFVILGVVLYPVSRTGVGGSPVPVSETVAALLYFTNYYILHNGAYSSYGVPFGICWSLAIEEHFYLIWPWVIYGTIKRSYWLCSTILGVCSIVLAWRLVVHYALVSTTDYTYMATDCRIDSILYGALLRVLLEVPGAAGVMKLIRTPACRLFGLLILLATFVVRDDGFRETFRYTLQGVALLPLFAAIVTDNPTSLARRTLRSPPFVFIGRLSYSIYLFHLLARTPGEYYFGSPYRVGSVISGLFLTGAISVTLFVLIERPIAKLRRRIRPAPEHSVGVDMIPGAVASAEQVRDDPNDRVQEQAVVPCGSPPAAERVLVPDYPVSHRTTPSSQRRSSRGKCITRSLRSELTE
jgi:peptidoglycan/LPS O-acetylase OafA/YrhL